MEQFNDNLLFRWFVGLNIDDPMWDHSTFSFNRQRLFDEAIAQRFFEHTVLLARLRGLASDEHLSVNGTLLEAWTSHKSSRPRHDRDGGDGDHFPGQPRSKETCASTTDPDARLPRNGQGKEAKLSYLANSPTGNRHGLGIAVHVRHASGTGSSTVRWICSAPPAWGEGPCSAPTRGTARRTLSTRYARAESSPISRATPATAVAALYRVPGRAPAVRHQPEGTQADRAGLWLDQDHWLAAQAAEGRACRGGRLGDLDVYRLEPDPGCWHRRMVRTIADASGGGNVRQQRRKILSDQHCRESHA